MDNLDYFDDNIEYHSDDKDLEEKLRQYKNLIKTKSKEELFFDSEDIEDLVYYCIDNENFFDAYDLVNLWVKTSSFSSEAWQMKGYILMRMECYTEAIKCLNKSLALNPNDIDSLLYKASALENISKSKRALQILEKILSLEPDNEEALFRKALLLGYRKIYNQAINIFKYLLKSELYYKNATVELACCYHYTKKYKLAIHYYQKAIDLEPYNDELWYNKAIVHSILGQKYLALDCLDMAITIKKDNLEAIYLKSKILRKLGKIKEAINCCEEGLITNPKNINLLYAIADLYVEIREYITAIDYYTLIISYNPNHYPSFFGRGICYDIIENRYLALDDYNSALRLNKKSPKIWQAKADLLYDMCRITEAIQCYEKALKYHPNNVSCLVDYGVALFENGQLKKAEKVFLQVILLSKKNIKAHLYLAKIYTMFGHIDISQKHILAAILIAPSYKSVYLYDYFETAIIYQSKSTMEKLNYIVKLIFQ